MIVAGFREVDNNRTACVLCGLPMEKSKRHPGLSLWIRTNIVAQTKLPVAEAASAAGDTIRKLPERKREQIAKAFTIEHEYRLAEDLIILGVCAIKDHPKKRVEYDPPVLLCDTVVAAKKIHPRFFRTLFNRKIGYVYSVWEVALKAACQRSVEQNKGVGGALMEIIEAADAFIINDGTNRLPQLYSALPEELPKWTGVKK